MAQQTLEGVSRSWTTRRDEKRRRISAVHSRVKHWWCCSFPLATVAVLFAARYKAVESEAASMLLVSTLALAVTVPTILWLTS
jgi:predicted permease